MNLFTLGLILDTFGKILIGLAVFRVHSHIFKEHKIDRDVLQVMRKEKTITILGILLIVVGAILQLVFYL